MSLKPFEIELSDQAVRLFPDEVALQDHRDEHPNNKKPLGIPVVFLFWQSEEQDYIKTYFREEDSTREVITYDQREFAIWLGGVALRPEDQRLLHLANRENGSFISQYGWGPMVAIKYQPTEAEQENYIHYETDLIDEDLKHLDERDE